MSKLVVFDGCARGRGRGRGQPVETAAETPADTLAANDSMSESEDTEDSGGILT